MSILPVKKDFLTSNSGLKQIVSINDKPSVANFIDTTVKEAFMELREEFLENGMKAEVKTFENPKRIEITLAYDRLNNFLYGVKLESQTVSSFILEEETLPEPEEDKRYFPESYFGDRRDGYDVQYFTKNELISDVLKHYERFLEIGAEEESELFMSSNINKRIY